MPSNIQTNMHEYAGAGIVNAAINGAGFINAPHLGKGTTLGPGKANSAIYRATHNQEYLKMDNHGWTKPIDVYNSHIGGALMSGATSHVILDNTDPEHPFYDSGNLGVQHFFPGDILFLGMPIYKDDTSTSGVIIGFSQVEYVAVKVITSHSGGMHQFTIERGVLGTSDITHSLGHFCGHAQFGSECSFFGAIKAVGGSVALDSLVDSNKQDVAAASGAFITLNDGALIEGRFTELKRSIAGAALNTGTLLIYKR